MEKRKKKGIIEIIVVALIIIAGIIVVVEKGFNFDLLYQNGKNIDINLKQKFEISEIEAISKEVLGKEVIVQTVEVYKEIVSITAKDITEEQRETIITKINEKYGLELKAEDSPITDVAHTRLRDILRPCVYPFILTTIFVLVYVGIRFIKPIGKGIILETLLIMILGQALLFSIIAITRIPISRYTLPMSLSVYALSAILCTFAYENHIVKQKEEADKQIESKENQ